jgi:heptosyltransferase-2
MLSSCRRCRHFSPLGRRILIIKLSATGDVLRTTPLLYGLKKKYPLSHITWLTGCPAFYLLKGNPLIDRLLCYNGETADYLRSREFDLVACFDKEERAAALASSLRARTKAGFGIDRHSGAVCALNRASRYAFLLGVCDDLKFRSNRKTYQEIIFESVGLKYRGEEYILPLPSEEKDRAGEFLSGLGIRKGDPLIGVNTGAGDAFAHKTWNERGFVSLVEMISGRMPESSILLLGGRKESGLNARLALQFSGRRVYDCGGYHSLPRFAAIIGRCSALVSGDTTAMHIAIALRVPVAAVFGSTCENEIDFYGRGAKVVSSLDCRPCYRKECGKTPNCMDSIPAGEVFSVLSGLLEDQ